MDKKSTKEQGISVNDLMEYFVAQDFAQRMSQISLFGLLDSKPCYDIIAGFALSIAKKSGLRNKEIAKMRKYALDAIEHTFASEAYYNFVGQENSEGIGND